MQQMDSGNTVSEQSQSEYGRYEGNLNVNSQASFGDPVNPQPLTSGSVYNPNISPYLDRGEKLHSDRYGGSPPEYRLGLAIVSAILITIVAVVMLIFSMSPGAFVVLGIVALVILLLNIIFNRWWFS